MQKHFKTRLPTDIDGQEIPKIELEKYRVQSPPFNFTLPKNNILGLPANVTTVAISDGNWVFIKPLNPGNHEIEFRGDVTSIENSTAATESESFAFPSGWNYSTTCGLLVK